MGITSAVDEEEIQQICSAPCVPEQNFLLFDDYHSLVSLATRLADGIINKDLPGEYSSDSKVMISFLKTARKSVQSESIFTPQGWCVVNSILCIINWKKLNNTEVMNTMRKVRSI